MHWKKTCLLHPEFSEQIEVSCSFSVQRVCIWVLNVPGKTLKNSSEQAQCSFFKDSAEWSWTLTGCLENPKHCLWCDPCRATGRYLVLPPAFTPQTWHPAEWSHCPSRCTHIPRVGHIRSQDPKEVGEKKLKEVHLFQNLFHSAHSKEAAWFWLCHAGISHNGQICPLS